MLRETCHETEQQQNHESVHLMNSFESTHTAPNKSLSSSHLAQLETKSNPLVRRCSRASRIVLLVPAALVILLSIVVLIKSGELIGESGGASEDNINKIALQLNILEKAFEEKLDARMRQLKDRLLDVLSQKCDDAGREKFLTSTGEGDGQRRRGNSRSRRDVKV